MKRSYAVMCASSNELDGGVGCDWDIDWDAASDSSDGHSDGETSTTDTDLGVERDCSPNTDTDSEFRPWGWYHGITKHHDDDSSRNGQWDQCDGYATYTSSWDSWNSWDDDHHGYWDGQWAKWDDYYDSWVDHRDGHDSPKSDQNLDQNDSSGNDRDSSIYAMEGETWGITWSEWEAAEDEDDVNDDDDDMHPVTLTPEGSPPIIRPVTPWTPEGPPPDSPPINPMIMNMVPVTPNMVPVTPPELFAFALSPFPSPRTPESQWIRLFQNGGLCICLNGLFPVPSGQRRVLVVVDMMTTTTTTDGICIVVGLAGCVCGILTFWILLNKKGVVDNLSH